VGPDPGQLQGRDRDRAEGPRLSPPLPAAAAAASRAVRRVKMTTGDRGGPRLIARVYFLTLIDWTWQIISAI